MAPKDRSSSTFYLGRLSEGVVGQGNKEIINHLLKLSSEQLISNLNKVRQGVYTIPKIETVRLFEIYLKVIDKFNLLEYEIGVLELYSDLSKTSSFAI